MDSIAIPLDLFEKFYDKNIENRKTAEKELKAEIELAKMKISEQLIVQETQWHISCMN